MPDVEDSTRRRSDIETHEIELADADTFLNLRENKLGDCDNNSSLVSLDDERLGLLLHDGDEQQPAGSTSICKEEMAADLSPTQLLKDDVYRLPNFSPRLVIGACALLAAFAFALGCFFLLVVHSSSNATSNVTANTVSHCSSLKREFGFWSDYQCSLWHYIEKNESIDMTPYKAKNIPLSDRFWSNKTQSPGSGKDGRVIYHLHLHKNMGSTFCKWFCATTRCNPRDNCNVPDTWWYNKSEPDLHYQWGAYIGCKRSQERYVYEQIQKSGWGYVASEGSLSDEPIFGADGPYYHTIILREPMDWVISMWHYESKAVKSISNGISLNEYLLNHLWGIPDFYTRRICGCSCVHNNPLTSQDFLIAKSRIDLFDLVLAQDMMEDVESIRRLFESEFPSLQFRQLGVKSNKGNYAKVNLTQFQINFIQNQTEMDKVLYEYGKILHQRRMETLLMQQHV